MNLITILCEGITDQAFIADCLEIFFNITVTRTSKSKDKIDMTFGKDSQIVSVGGCSKISNRLILDSLLDNTKKGGRNIVFFDADFDTLGRDDKQGTGNNGFKSAKQKLTDIQIQHKVVFDFYLWHNNNHDGEVEDLLCQLVPSEKKELFNCFKGFNSCLKKSSIQQLKLPTLKEHINSYLHLCNQDPKNRNYKNKEFWDMDHEKCSDLLRLRDFLMPILLANEQIQYEH